MASDFDVAKWVSEKVDLLARVWDWSQHRAAFQVMCDIDDNVSDCPDNHQRAAMEALLRIYLEAKEVPRGE